MLKTSWQTHNFKVKMLDWSADRGSRLAYLCRLCGRRFCMFAKQGGKIWAVDGDGHAIGVAANERWLSEACPPLFKAGDENDRKRPDEGAEQ